jgi:hypothetical protein
VKFSLTLTVFQLEFEPRFSQSSTRFANCATRLFNSDKLLFNSEFYSLKKVQLKLVQDNPKLTEVKLELNWTRVNKSWTQSWSCVIQPHNFFLLAFSWFWKLNSRFIAIFEFNSSWTGTNPDSTQVQLFSVSERTFGQSCKLNFSTNLWTTLVSYPPLVVGKLFHGAVVCKMYRTTFWKCFSPWKAPRKITKNHEK